MINPTITEFAKKLRANAIGPGARWVTADFHVHLPTGHDYLYRDADAFQRLGNALESARLSFAVVLKHESFATKAELAQLQEHCPSVALIPGVEINCFVDALFKKVGKDYFFHCIVAADPDDRDEYGHVLRAARDKFQYREGDYPAGFRSGIVDVAAQFRNAGALFIPAHLHQAKSPEESRSIDDLYEDEAFLGFVGGGAFDALEVRDVKTATFFDGTKKTKDGLQIPRISCVRSSDAHHHNGVGSKQTWIRCEKETFGELKAALALPYRVSLTEPGSSHARVVGLHVAGSFITEAWVSLNDGLNALIGGKGSGKTALLECLRFVLNTPVPKPRAEEVQKHMQHILGSGGYVECLVRDASGQQTLLVRRADSHDRITIVPEQGDSRTVPASNGQMFPISILGWHEIESVADHASARIDILDRAGDPEIVAEARLEIEKSVAQARDTLPLLQRQARRLDTALQELWELRRKRATLTKLAEERLSALQDQYDAFLRAEQGLGAIAPAATGRKAQLQEIIPSRIDSAIKLPLDEEPFALLGKAIGNVESRAKALSDAEVDAISAFSASLDALSGAAVEAETALGVAFLAFREEVYVPAVAALSPEEREVLTKQIQVLEETKRLPSVESACIEQLRELRTLASQLHASCAAVCEQRDRIVKARSDLVESLNAELSGVKLVFQRASNREGRSRFQGAYPADGAAIIGYVDGFEGADAYEKLRDLFAKIQLLDIDQDKWSIKVYLLDAKLVDLLDVIDDDDVTIALQVGKRGLVEIQNLSAGQRCVAVFPLLLRNTRGPLVIDQPEDNLDNRYIADNIAPDLLHKKRSQQYLVTSHNANLVVLTDADLIVHVDSDGTHSEFPASGFLAWENSAVKPSVLGVLDGGEAALLARQKKYGLRVS